MDLDGLLFNLENVTASKAKSVSANSDPFLDMLEKSRTMPTLSTDNNEDTDNKSISTPIKKIDKEKMVNYSEEEALEEATKYFKGDNLAAEVWVKKYALKDSEGNLYEKSPDDMHRRIAREIARIDKNYKNPVDEETIYE